MKNLMNRFNKWVPVHYNLRFAGFVISPILFTIIISYPIEGLVFEAKLVLGLAVWMAVWWVCISTA
jgi:hypothetical protein